MCCRRHGTARAAGRERCKPQLQTPTGIAPKHSRVWREGAQAQPTLPRWSSQFPAQLDPVEMEKLTAFPAWVFLPLCVFQTHPLHTPKLNHPAFRLRADHQQERTKKSVLFHRPFMFCFPRPPQLEGDKPRFSSPPDLEISSTLKTLNWRPSSVTYCLCDPGQALWLRCVVGPHIQKYKYPK